MIPWCFLKFKQKKRNKWVFISIQSYNLSVKSLQNLQAKALKLKRRKESRTYPMWLFTGHFGYTGTRNTFSFLHPAVSTQYEFKILTVLPFRSPLEVAVCLSLTGKRYHRSAGFIKVKQRVCSSALSCMTLTFDVIYPTVVEFFN